MKADQANTSVKAIKELSESYIDAMHTLKATSKDIKKAKQLWHSANKSRLIKIGLALIVFPEPTPISETVGTCFVAAGAIQQAIRNRSIYIEDITKTLQITLQEVSAFKDNVSR